MCARQSITPGSSRQLQSIVSDLVAVAYLIKISNVCLQFQMVSFSNLRGVSLLENLAISWSLFSKSNSKHLTEEGSSQIVQLKLLVDVKVIFVGLNFLKIFIQCATILIEQKCTLPLSRSKHQLRST
ncbi:hypothetical protein FGO68_gene7673 [Halteria grandinella]|uniref:Uncharacterized protein n=1 Tax=Halteria grandinella TaxID=5974 RepID=A0A8J8P0F2_HALGN|nr:hypothetical protein FGO68_gene7673 [Halteria grandinella]